MKTLGKPTNVLNCNFSYHVIEIEDKDCDYVTFRTASENTG